MRLIVERHTETHELICRTVDGSQIMADPFVSGAVPHDAADALVGKTVDMSDYWLSSDGCYLCNEFREVQPADGYQYFCDEQSPNHWG